MTRAARELPPVHESLDPRSLVAEHGPVVWALCRRSAPDPEDAYQDVWAHALGRLDRYDPGRGAFRPWLLSLVHRRLVDRHRRRAVRGVVQVAPELPDPSPPVDEIVAGTRRRERLEAALSRLPEAQRRVVVAHHVHGRALDAIAADEGVAVGTVKSRLHRGRAALVRLLARSP